MLRSELSLSLSLAVSVSLSLSLSVSLSLSLSLSQVGGRDGRGSGARGAQGPGQRRLESVERFR